MTVSNRYVFTLLFFAFIFVSCNNDYYPKPRGYFRIDLPEKNYQLFDTAFPYRFEYPVYSKIVFDTLPNAEPYWINITFKEFKGTLHLSYKKINHNLNQYLEDTRSMAMKHIPKASGIENRQFVNPETKVYGLIYDISGSGAASPYQFYVTDSVAHFVRGALYFNSVPNNDSLAPVIQFLEADINHMIETFRWKEIN
ncbi:MAG: gliding motility lipoprotein GldD [Bacteroidetes bacterium]|nr:gliding motility lipoprotein GldD [Bacteroidota bacterium]